MTALTPIYIVVGLMPLALAWRAARDPARPRPFAAASFWGLLATIFIAGDWLPPVLVGAMVVVMALLAGFGGVVRPAARDERAAQREADAWRLGNALFVPALCIPLVTVVFVIGFKTCAMFGWPLVAENQVTQISLAVGCLAGLILALSYTRATPLHALNASGDLLDAIGWAVVLPIVLAALGAVFTAAGAGEAIAEIVSKLVPTDNRLACVLAYALGMAAFTMVMGNAFAAFPVMTAGIGLPLLVGRHGADPASMSALGMLSGYCGTLMTPMAANFNIVPAALLELRDQNAVIKAQVPTALMLLACNVVLMYFIVFR